MIRYFMPLVLFALLVCGSPAESAEAMTTTERTYRIAYLENGNYWLFNATLAAIQTQLAQHPLRVEYPAALHLSPGWNASEETLLQAAKHIFAAKPDLILAAGTGAAKALLTANDGTTPILGIALADPIAAGIMQTPTQPVVNNLMASVIPDRWQNMYRVFHDVVGFHKLGVMYPAGPHGRIYASVDDAHVVAKQEGFDVIEVMIQDESVAACQKGLATLHEQGVDAFFIGPLNCFDWTNTTGVQLIDSLTSMGIPTFARDGSPYVQAGALLGFSTWDFTPTAKQLVDGIVRIFAGEAIKDIPLVGISEPIIAINLETARILGIDLPFDVLVAADQLFEQTIPAPQP